MKSIWLVLCACFVQICLSAPIAKKSDGNPFNGLSSDDVQSLRDEWSSIPDVDQQAVEKLANVMKKFHSNSTDLELIQGTVDLLNIAMNENIPEENRVELKIVVNDDEESKSKELTDNSNDQKDANELEVESGETLTIDNLNGFEKELSEKLNPSQTRRAMNLFKGLRMDATSKETETALVDLFNDAVQATLGKSYMLGGENSLNDVDENNNV